MRIVVDNKWAYIHCSSLGHTYKHMNVKGYLMIMMIHENAQRVQMIIEMLSQSYVVYHKDKQIMAVSKLANESSIGLQCIM